MITIELQQKLFLDISSQLKKPINAYAVGGTAMMFLGLKEATLDIDLVFETESDMNGFRKAAEKLGYREINSAIIYGLKRNQPVMVSLGEIRFDLFTANVINFVFSEDMQKRAKKNAHQFGSGLIVNIADPHDIILMKCATDRLKDTDDARKIIENTTRMDWRILTEEARNQIALGKYMAALELGYFLERLKEKIGVNIPKYVLDELFEIVKEQADNKQKR